MADYKAVLRELMLAGYEGATLLAAFGRMCAAIGGEAAAPAVTGRAAAGAERASPVRAQGDIKGDMLREAGPPPDNAKAIGQKALALSGLAGATVTVGAVLLDHLNLRTGRCDPGRARLAEKAGISVRQVHRAINDLVAAGLFAVARHGGLGHRSAYAANWGEMMRLVAASENAGAGQGGQKSPVQGDKNVRQNQLRKPDQTPLPEKGTRPARSRQPDPRQREILLPMAGGAASGQVAETTARNRLREAMDAHLRQRLMPDKAAFVEACQRAWAVDMAPIVAAEMTRRGTGLRLWLEAMDAPQGRQAGAGR